MLNVLICGINGQIGQRVYKATKDAGFNVVCGVDTAITGDFNCPVYKSFDEVKEDVDVVIDFSATELLPNVLAFVLENKYPLVEGTTGFNKAQKAMVDEASKKVPIFISSNMSLGVNLTLKLCTLAAKTLKNYDIEIIEKHHNKKIDAPSGTALMLANGICEVLGERKISYGRSSKRKDGEICIHSIRGGSIVGEHEVLFIGEDEILTISHQAEDKSLFAKGAIKVAEYLVGKKAGLYTMKDYFNE